jgi:hypothetical protein
MAVRSNLLEDLLPRRFNVGLSSILGITNLPGQLSISIQYMSGGTLEIVAPGASIGWGNGWVMPQFSIATFDANGTIWLASSGATTVVSVITGRGEGFAGASLGFRG